MRKGGDSGPAIDVDNLANSLLLEVVLYDGDIQMPPKGKLSDQEIADFTKWIEEGAPMPPSSDVPERSSDGIDFAAGRQFWSFQPAEIQPEPEVQMQDWPKSRMDLFVLAAMEQQGLTPSPQADRATLIRRLSFDLQGLPPTPEEVRAFVSDESPQAYEQLVDRLLQSPHYGEKWARFWLDMARYTDKTASWLYATGQAHLYRDWVVKAFNDDMPYDDFVHRQLATDLIPETGPDDLPALGFISLSPTYWKELKLPCEIINTIVADEWEERVDATSRTFLGLTVACARCHDHKFDPISSEDYYGLAGVFASCRQVERPTIAEAAYEPVRKAKEQVAALEAEIAKLQKQKPPAKEKIDELTAQITTIKTSTPLYDTPMANVVSEESLYVVRAGKTPQDGTRLDYRPEPRDLPLFIRGNPNRPGPLVPRRFLTVLSNTSKQNSKPEPFANGSGRLDLAMAMTTDAASLTARVIVNRIWLAHFGRGLVTTPSNFGRQGAAPSHPELLDDMAARFIANGWSIKQLHREILLSATWQQSSDFVEHKTAVDPDNRWLSRMNRRRLNFESWRDAMLSATGTLDLTLGGPAADLDQADNHRRTLYATVHRRDMSTTLTIHDFPDPTQHSPARSSTTTPLQGLYALNGPLLTQQANALTKRLSQEFPDDDPARINRAYWLLYSRAPTEDETRLALEFLGDSSADTHESRWKQYTHVLLASNELLFID
jgi:cytochrome c553